MAEDWSLPGGPRKKLVREVRKHLRHYGLVPGKCQYTIWRNTWAWAYEVAKSYMPAIVGPKGKRRFSGRYRWPIPSEIGAQYVALLLADMRDSRQLNLPYRAGECIPPQIAVALTPLLPALDPRQSQLKLLPAATN